VRSPLELRRLHEETHVLNHPADWARVSGPAEQVKAEQPCAMPTRRGGHGGTQNTQGGMSAGQAPERCAQRYGKKKREFSGYSWVTTRVVDLEGYRSLIPDAMVCGRRGEQWHG
jgi:hypothetical protein